MAEIVITLNTFPNNRLIVGGREIWFNGFERVGDRYYLKLFVDGSIGGSTLWYIPEQMIREFYPGYIVEVSSYALSGTITLKIIYPGLAQPPACIPSWVCEPGQTGLEVDGCGNKRQNPVCAAVPPAKHASKSGLYLAVGTTAFIGAVGFVALTKEK